MSKEFPQRIKELRKYLGDQWKAGESYHEDRFCFPLDKQQLIDLCELVDNTTHFLTMWENRATKLEELLAKERGRVFDLEDQLAEAKRELQEERSS